MDCTRARDGLWPPERPRLAGADVLAARSHVEQCPECQGFFDQDRALLDLYHRLREVEAPGRARERVFDALATARRRSTDTESDGGPEVRTPPVRGVWAWPVAAAVAVGVFALAWQPTAGPVSGGMASAPTDGAMFVEDYLRRAVGQDHIVTSDPDEVRRFLTRELGVQIGPLLLDGLDLERAEICLLEGRRGAMIVYKKDGVPISHYLVPREGGQVRMPSLSAAPDASALPVVTWSTSALEQAVVAELAPAELLQMARSGS